jgi:hypothetical protein
LNRDIHLARTEHAQQSLVDKRNDPVIRMSAVPSDVKVKHPSRHFLPDRDDNGGLRLDIVSNRTGQSNLDAER